MSESRILVIDADAPRAERLAGLLEFMDLTPRWVASAGDVDVRRARQHDWLAVVVGSLDNQKAADTFFAWLGKAALPPIPAKRMRRPSKSSSFSMGLANQPAPSGPMMLHSIGWILCGA